MLINLNDPIETYYSTKSKAYEAGRAEGFIFGLFIGAVILFALLIK